MAMWNPFKRLFGDRPAPGAPAPVSSPPAAASRSGPSSEQPLPSPNVSPRASPGFAETSPSSLDGFAPTAASTLDGFAPTAASALDAIDATAPTADVLPQLAARFTAAVLGGSAPLAHALSGPEHEALARLQALLAQGLDAASVPRLPAVLPRLMAMARRDDASPRELADVLARDPALVGDVVRMANSARYGAQRPIEDLTGALMMLGQIGLSQLVTRAAVRPIFRIAQGSMGQAAAARLSELSERCSHASASRGAGAPDAFAAYLAGTAAPVGLLVAFRTLDRSAPLAGPGSDEFHAALWRAALALSVQAARQWAFPDDVVQTLGHLCGPALGADHAATDPATRAVRAGLTAALRQHLGAAADDLPASPGETLLVAELDRTFSMQSTRV